MTKLTQLGETAAGKDVSRLARSNSAMKPYGAGEALTERKEAVARIRLRKATIVLCG